MPLRVLMTLALITACGGGQTFCEQQAHLLEDCPDAVDETVAECEAALVDCDETDQSSLLAFTDCTLDAGVDFCAAVGSSTAGETGGLAALACLGEISDLSAPCAEAALILSF